MGASDLSRRLEGPQKSTLKSLNCPKMAENRRERTHGSQRKPSRICLPACPARGRQGTRRTGRRASSRMPFDGQAMIKLSKNQRRFGPGAKNSYPAGIAALKRKERRSPRNKGRKMGAERSPFARAWRRTSSVSFVCGQSLISSLGGLRLLAPAPYLYTLFLGFGC